MILAAHGYLAISLDFMDGTATQSTDKDGNEIHFKWPESNGGKPNNADGTPNQGFNDFLRQNQIDRVNESQALGNQIKKDGFAKSLDLNC